ncbi:hypothetical protein QE152_g40482 [Popillia japonica]|uniref:DUF5641 domain-containing protein n=1 Tax=Popillia japonica TaxID=7064 RepID=A0AAW1HGB6_POPJA
MEKAPAKHQGWFVSVGEGRQFSPKQMAARTCHTVLSRSDGQVRVADIKCARGVFKRPVVVKLCPLPMQGIEAKIVPSQQAVASEG